MNKKAFVGIPVLIVVVLVLAVVVGVAVYLYPHKTDQVQDITSQSTQTSTVGSIIITTSSISNSTTTLTPTSTVLIPTSTVHPVSPPLLYPVVWQEGKFSYAIATSSVHMGQPIPCEIDPSAGGGCPLSPSFIYLYLKITNDDTISHPTSDIPFHISEIDAKGVQTAPSKIIFTDGDNILKAGETDNVEMYFQSNTWASSAFTTGGLSNIFFFVTDTITYDSAGVNKIQNIKKTNCTFPTTSTTCAGEIQ